MKLLAILYILLITIIFTLGNNHGCNDLPCGVGNICHLKGNECSCIEIGKCNSVKLIQTVKNIWEVDRKLYTQYDIGIINNLDKDINQIYIGVNESLTLKDFSSFWNINRLPNGELILPGYQPSISKYGTFSFGFIIIGDAKPDVVILSVAFAE